MVTLSVLVESLNNPPSPEMSVLLDDDLDTCLSLFDSDPPSVVPYKESLKVTHSASHGMITIKEGIKDVTNCSNTGLYLYTDSGDQCGDVSVCELLTSTPVGSACSVQCHCPPPSCIVHGIIIQGYIYETWRLCELKAYEP